MKIFLNFIPKKWMPILSPARSSTAFPRPHRKHLPDFSFVFFFIIFGIPQSLPHIKGIAWVLEEPCATPLLSLKYPRVVSPAPYRPYFNINRPSKCVWVCVCACVCVYQDVCFVCLYMWECLSDLLEMCVCVWLCDSPCISLCISDCFCVCVFEFLADWLCWGVCLSLSVWVDVVLCLIVFLC